MVASFGAKTNTYLSVVCLHYRSLAPRYSEQIKEPAAILSVSRKKVLQYGGPVRELFGTEVYMFACKISRSIFGSIVNEIISGVQILMM